ncbi:MAG: TetR/AcrR family transcriptional regulator [Arenicella sp.]|jgi:AcrR family transcriptional regulator|nr:TetR/AcrR family transcriptional regulator [Arenicella sp.]
MNQTSNNSNLVPVTFRVRVAKEKRERMRQRIQVAAVEIFSTASAVKAPVIEDIIQQAGISRGSFYKYYDSLDSLLTEIGKQTASDILHAYQSMLPILDNAPAYLLAGPILSMLHAAMQPGKALMISRIDFVEYFSQEDRLREIVQEALSDNQRQQNIHYGSLDLATDFVVGSTLEAILRVANDKRIREDYIKNMTLMIAAGLNMHPDQARQAVDTSWQRILSNSKIFTWWQTEQLDQKKVTQG